MNRREFVSGVALGLLAAPLAAEGQQAGKVPRIGFLGVFAGPNFDAFRQALREVGWVEGQNIVIDHRSAEGRLDRLPGLAAELVRLKVDIIVAEGTQGVTAAKNATETIPIVMIAGSADPVGLGFIASLARPGGNVTKSPDALRGTFVRQTLGEAGTEITDVIHAGGTGPVRYKLSAGYDRTNQFANSSIGRTDDQLGRADARATLTSRGGSTRPPSSPSPSASPSSIDGSWASPRRSAPRRRRDIRGTPS